MDCYLPGRVLILPDEHPEELKWRLSDALNMPFEILYSVQDVLEHYGFSTAIGAIREKFGHLPFVARVPEGRGIEATEQLRNLKSYIAAACPDFVIRPSSAIEINRSAVDRAIARLGAEPVSSQCGQGCTIAVLDTGIDPGLLGAPQALDPVQYDAQAPAQPGGAAGDSLGHGTLVGHIINRIAPAAKIVSIKTMNESGSVGALIAALYLAEAAGPCDLVNMSLSVGCEPTRCKVCGNPTSATVNSEQLGCFFSRISGGWARGGSAVAMIAAAGNGYHHLAMPASFPEAIAVGAFDLDSEDVANYSRYLHVPAERYLLAPGGLQDAVSSFAIPLRASFRPSSGLYGTSFAAAFVTGIAARHICALRGGACGTLRPTSRATDDVVTHLRLRLAENADRSWASYNAEVHGLGLVRYSV
jgi:hypothetical protein